MKSIIKVLTIAGVCLSIGLFVAYYNTSSLGYDNANIISYNETEVQIFDTTINYKDFFQKLNKVKDFVPNSFLTI